MKGGKLTQDEEWKRLNAIKNMKIRDSNEHLKAKNGGCEKMR